MRLVVQRVKNAQVEVEGKVVGAISNGALVFFACHQKDTQEQISYLAQKLVHLRFFSDQNDKMNLSLLDVKGEILIISQFTLYGDTSQGRRPFFGEAMEPIQAEKLYNLFVEEVKKFGLKVQTGIFQAMMLVTSTNDGPVTLLVDAK
jgi:D-tyrosyl-tRNA(Tyr) deacylase